MELRTIPGSFDPAAVDVIEERLDSVQRENAVRILLAIESGSRAWGFPSPDSDYDCRFLYVRRQTAYLSLWPSRDVIETPLEGLLDVSGWDLAKALRLILKGNAVVVEWLRSPIVYRGHAGARAALERFAAEHAPGPAVRRHYLHLGLAQWRRHGAGPISGKKLFYALRPAAALRWMRLHDGALPPMHFPTLMAQCRAEAAVEDCVAALLARKAETRELGPAAIPEGIARFIEQEYALAQDDEVTPPAGGRDAADALFRRMVDEFAPT